jgi:hypothetical protein
VSEKPPTSRLVIRSLKSPELGSKSRLSGTKRKTSLRSSPPPGYLDGLHHTLFVPAIRTLKSSGQQGDLEHLLLRLVDATEAEARHTGCAVASGYYRELARLYRRSKDATREQAILLRFAAQTHAPGLRARRLVKRLATLPRDPSVAGGGQG